jgi:hypothetical protein
MMKPWQTPLNKALSKGEKKEKKERNQVRAKRAECKMGHKGASEQIMFQSPHHSQGAYKKEKGMET